VITSTSVLTLNATLDQGLVFSFPVQVITPPSAPS